MQFQLDNLVWTRHSLAKISFYNLSQSRVKRVLRYPLRVEEGIVPGTIAAMQVAGSKKHPYEVWVMYQIKTFSSSNFCKPKALAEKQSREEILSGKENQKSITLSQSQGRSEVSELFPVGSSKSFFSHQKQVIIISAWKYPGITKPGAPIPIPQDILEEILKNYS